MIMLYNLVIEHVGAPWSSGAWGPGPNGPVVDPPLHSYLCMKNTKYIFLICDILFNVHKVKFRYIIIVPKFHNSAVYISLST